MLRDYQKLALDMIREEFRKGNKKVLLQLSTGAGKTVCFTTMMKEAAARGKKSVMFVRGKMLVQQAHERLLAEKTPHGVMMAGHYFRNAMAPIQICSIDTIVAREKYPEADLVIIDEAHMAVSKGYVETMKMYPNAYVVAVTATPYTRDPLRHIADSVVAPISFRELVDQGYLIPPKYFSPSIPDLTGVATSAGDYVQNELKNRMAVLSGDIVQTWIDKGEGRPTICFAVNIEHSQMLVRSFVAGGIPAQHIEGNDPKSVRDAAIKRLVNGEIKILSNCGVLCTGVDIPPVSCIIMARPTKSANLFIQQAGRGTRPLYADGFDLSQIAGRLAAINCSEKKTFTILDHAGNILRHGFMTKDREVNLDGKPKLDTGPAVKTCATCYLNYSGSSCPECGETVQEKRDRELLTDEGIELKEIKDMPLAAKLVQFVKEQKEIAKKRGYKRGWVYHQVKNAFGEETANDLFPKRNIPSWIKR